MPTRILFDLEANGLLEVEGDKPAATTVWCVSAIDIDTREEFFFGPNEIKELALSLLADADVLAGHNIQRYDLPLLRKLYGFQPKAIVRDTMILARLKFPNVKDTDYELVARGKLPGTYLGKHSIGAWGHRLGKPKLHEDIEDWSAYTVAMGERCVGDAWTNLALWDHLYAGYVPPERAVQLEHDIQLVCDMMQTAGVPFNVEKAGELHTELLGRQFELKKVLVAQFGTWVAPISPNNHEVTPRVSNKTRGITKGEPYCKLKYVTFNPGSRQHIAKVLRARGWYPTSKTLKGHDTIDEQEIERIISMFPEMAGLGEYMMIDKRLGQLVSGKQALLNHVGKDGRIHGVINPMGTATSRGTHFHPNLSQVPSGKKPYGGRFRGLFEVPEEWVLVGADMDGLEDKGFAHYMVPVDGGAYRSLSLSGDPHWASAQYLGLIKPGEVRDKTNRQHVILREGAKVFRYAFIYGAWIEKCGSIILDTVLDARKEGFPELYNKFFFQGHDQDDIKRVGKRARNNFVKKMPGMDKLLFKLNEQIQKHGWLPGLDGRRVPVRSSHSALNFIIQSCGAILCKRWVVDAVFDLLGQGLKHGWEGDFTVCLWVHDELQVACRWWLADQVGKTLVKHAKAAGETYDFRVPLNSSYSVGKSWAETH
jgi:DNA polymerase I